MVSNQPNYLRFIGLTVIIILSIALRMYAVIHTVIDRPIRRDSAEYYNYALNLKYKHTYSRQSFTDQNIKPDTMRSPGYPVFLIPFVKYPPSDSMLFIINIVQAFLDAASVLLAYLIFKYFISQIPAFIAALLTAISPHLISMNTYMLSETLFTFLMMVSFWLLIETYSRNKIIFALIGGIVFASAALTRPTLQYFIVFIVGLIIYQCKLKTALRLILPLILGFLIFITPWLLYNLSVIGKISDSTLAKNTVYHGIYPDFMYNGIATSRGIPYRFDPNSKNISQNYETIFSEITRRFRNEPYKYFKWYLLDKPLTFFSWSIIAGAGDVFFCPPKYSPYFDIQLYKFTHLFMKIAHWPLVLLAFISSILIWTKFYTKKLSDKSLFAIRLLSLLLFYFIGLHIIGAPYPRYSIPLRPVIYGLAIFTCSRCFYFFKEIINKTALSA